MDLKTVALAMYPYWIMGAFAIVAAIKGGHKDAVRVEPKAVGAFLKFLCVITLYRAVLFKLFPNFGMFKEAGHTITSIPWQLTLTVFWEDACHGLPLLLLQRFIGTEKWWAKAINFIALAFVMIEFGLGHVYQGLIAATLLSFYIPYSIKMGKKFGFGTVMICHTLYDLSTILSLKFLLGL